MRLVILLLTLLPIINGYKILYLAPFPAPSHWMWLKHFAEALVARGHEVTAITNYRTTKPHPNYTEVIIEPMYNVGKDFPITDFFGMKFDSVWNNLFLTWDIGIYSTEHAFKDKNVNAFIHRDDLQFDVIVLEQFFHDSWLPFASKFNAPIVTIATLGHADYFDHSMGFWTPWSYVPHHVLTFNDNMSFIERCINIFWGVVDVGLRRLHYMEKMQQMANKYFPDPTPSIVELEKNISFRIINSHRSMMQPRPSMPGLAYVAGIHIKPPQQLPNDIQEFLDNESQHGVIYFSFGSCIRSVDMPPEKLNAFIQAFSHLKQKVLWKFENETFPNLPKNVMIRKWMPQSDVLAHKNVILYINHGGVFGTQEGINRGVPMLFIPIYSDQFRNAKRCVDAGYGLMLRFSDVSSQNILEALKTMLSNTKYSEKVKEVSALFRDNPIDPMDEAMYWIEYVARHQGAKVFQSNARHIPWYIYLHLDIVAAVVAAIAIMLIIVKFVYFSCLRYLVNEPLANSKLKNQ